MTEKEFRVARREIEALHDSIEEPLTALQSQYEAITNEIAPLEAKRRAIELEMDKLKSGLHTKRLELAAKIEEHRKALEKEMKVST